MRVRGSVILGLATCAISAVAQPAFAGNPPANCTPNTFQAPCAHDGVNPCSGICLPQYGDASFTMLCYPADTRIVSSSEADSGVGVEGYPCSPDGSIPNDCTHSCRSGSCEANNAIVGAACEAPDGAPNVCGGICGDSGACVANETAGWNYEGWQPGECDFFSCQAVNALGNIEANLPIGFPCSLNDPCIVNTACSEQGGCEGTPVIDCRDAAADTAEDHDDAGADEDAADDERGTSSTEETGPRGRDATKSATDASANHSGSAPSSGGGCGVSKDNASGGAAAIWLLTLGAWVAKRRRRAR